MTRDWDLAEVETELARFVDSINCGVVSRGSDGRIAYANERLAGWLQYSRDELIGKPITVLLPPELRQAYLDEAKAIDEGDVRTRLVALQRRDSTTFPVLIIPQRLADPRGRYATLTVVVDLGSVQTAKHVSEADPKNLRATLQGIALQLQAASVVADGRASPEALLRHPELSPLSPREKEILALLLDGERVPAIAEQLHISPHTVRNHLKSMYRKLDVQSQSQLVHRVRALGE